MGQQYSLGYTNDVDNQNTDGGKVVFGSGVTTVAVSYSAPVLGILSNSEKLLPLFLMNNCRLAFTLDTASNITSAITANSKITNFSISNFEISYNQIQMGGAVERDIIARSPKLRIKTSSYATSMSPQLVAGVSGSQTMTFNLRYASIKSAFMNFGGVGPTGSANQQFDSFDITGTAGGDYSFQIGGLSYPQKPLSTKNNKAGVLSELRRAVGSLFGKEVTLAITATEFGGYTTAGPTTTVIPSKFWLGVNLSKMTVDQKGFFLGVSSQLAPINLNVNIGTATSYAINPMLIVYYDSIIEIDSQSKQVLMIQ
jgi:hypothetical protein